MTMLLLLFLFQEKPATVWVDRVAIKVNDKIITEREVVHSYKIRRAEAMQQFTGAELDQQLKKAWQETLADLEERLLLYEKSVELGIAVSEDDSRGRLMALKESNGLSDEEFEEVLQQQTGMTFEEYVSFRQREDSATYVVQSQVLSRINIEDSEIAKYFDENVNSYQNPATYRIAEIVFLKNGDGSAARRSTECMAFLENGGDFAEAARKYSDSTSKESGGDLGSVQYGDFNQAIEDRVAGLQVGEYSEVFQTETAVFIIKLLERTNSTPKRIEEVRDDIIGILREPRMNTEMDAYMADLKATYLLQTYVNKEEPPSYLQ